MQTSIMISTSMTYRLSRCILKLVSSQADFQTNSFEFQLLDSSHLRHIIEEFEIHPRRMDDDQ